MAASLIVPVVAPSLAAVPPDSSHYTLFIADGTEGSTAGTYYKKNSASVSTALIPAAFTSEDAQDAAAALFSNSTELTIAYNDAGNAIGITVNANSITYAKIQQVSATQRLLGRTTAGAGNIEELTVAQLETMCAWTQATRSIIADGAGLTNATTEQIISGSAFTIPANTLVAGDTLHLHVSLAVVQALIATATNTLIRFHLGPLGTTADPTVASTAVNLNGTVAGTRPLIIDGFVTVRSSTTVIGDVAASGSAIIAPVAATTGGAVTAPVALNVAVANILMATIQQPTANITAGNARVACIRRAA